ncbi:MAG TPA: hypothetical protein DCM40_36180 [Maribacter sp.]|nr:hypothetical protein [Maribacter sp.]
MLVAGCWLLVVGKLKYKLKLKNQIQVQVQESSSRVKFKFKFKFKLTYFVLNTFFYWFLAFGYYASRYLVLSNKYLGTEILY